MIIWQYVEFVTVKGKLFFRAANVEEMQKYCLSDCSWQRSKYWICLVDRTSGMTDTEKIVYQIIKSAKNKGIWIKDIKSKSNLHSQLVNTNIKSLEKKSMIKSVKSVKVWDTFPSIYNVTRLTLFMKPRTPRKKCTCSMILSHRLSLLVELGILIKSWMSNLSTSFQTSCTSLFCQRCVCHKKRAKRKLIRSLGCIQQSYPTQKQDAIYSASYDAYPTLNFLHKWIKKSGITSVELSVGDVSALLDRLVYDGKIVKSPCTQSGVLSDANNTDSEWEGDEKVVGDLTSSSWMYKATRSTRDGRSAFTDTPCGQCPVFDFCKEGGPVSPSGCVYLKDWLNQDIWSRIHSSLTERWLETECLPCSQFKGHCIVKERSVTNTN